MATEQASGHVVENSAGAPGRQVSEGDVARQCRFCSRAVDVDFRFCPWCGKRLGPAGGGKWYHSRWAVVLGLATMGPFALPLLWSNPQCRPLTKVIVTVVVLALTALLVYAVVLVSMRVAELLKELLEAY